MISFNYENDFKLNNESLVSNWISSVIIEEEFKEDTINYVFCNDDYLHQLNVEFLNHDTLTDIISFDYSVGKNIQGDIFISTERVAENATLYQVDFIQELYRVIVHGVLHYCGYKDKNDIDKTLMREKEDYYLKLIA